VVGKPHDIKGESVFAYVVCRGVRPTGDVAAITKELREWVSQELGAIARPDDIRFADNLPKTRSGKIMRRLLRTIARGEEITQDVSTLENPTIIDQLRGVDTPPSGAKVAAKSGAPASAKARKPAKSAKSAGRKAKSAARKSARSSAKRAARKTSARAKARRSTKAPRRKTVKAARKK
jgi:hypothetical protein